jgi:hypothetical protein
MSDRIDGFEATPDGVRTSSSVPADQIVKVFSFNVYITPKSMNNGGGGSRQHWSKGYKSKKAWEEAIKQELMVLRVPRGAEHVNALVTLNWKRRLGLDTTNYYPDVIKPLADALVQFGLLADDTEDFFTVGSFTSKYPTEWPAVAGRLQGFAAISLEARYP